jgi:hypothetical protein
MIISYYSIVQCYGYLTSSNHQLYRVTPLKTPFGLLSYLITISITRNYNHNYLLRCATFTQLTIIHVRDYNHLLHSYTFTLADFSPINYCLKLSHTLHLHTLKLSPRSYSANSLLKNPLENWLLKTDSRTANRFAYIARTSETKNGASQLCCVVTVFTRRCLGNERDAVWRHRGLLCSNAQCGSAQDGTARRKHCLPHRRAARTRSRGV